MSLPPPDAPGPAEAPAAAAVRPAPARRLEPFAPAAVAVVLALLALPAPGALLPGVLLLAGVAVLQVLLVLGLLSLVDAPARTGSAVLALAAAAAADAVALRAHGRVGGLAGVLGLALVGALLHELVRRGGRPAVASSLSAGLAAVALAVSAACLVALAVLSAHLAATALLAAAAGLVAVRLVRAWRPGPVAGLAAAAAAGAVVGALLGAADDRAVGGAALLGLGVALAAAVGAGLLAAVAPGVEGARRTAALRPVGALLPVAVAGPVALVAGRLLLGGVSRVGRVRVAAGVALVLVLGLVVAADRVGEHVAEGLLADQVSRELGVRPDVEIGGVPFLTQALTGHYRDLRLTAPRVDGSGVRLDDVEVRLSGADVPLSSVVRGSVDAVPVDRLRVQGVVPYDELEAAAGRDVQLSAAPGGVRVSGTIRVLGQSVPASATSTVSLDGDRLVLTARDAAGGRGHRPAVRGARPQPGGAGAAVRRAAHLRRGRTGRRHRERPGHRHGAAAVTHEGDLRPLLAGHGEAGERATLVHFSSAFCAPCRATRRVLHDVAAAVPGVTTVEVDAEARLDLVRRLGVESTPTTLVLGPDGREVRRASGLPTPAQVLQALTW